MKKSKADNSELMRKLRIRSLTTFIEHVESGEYIPDFETKDEAIASAKEELARLMQQITGGGYEKM